MNSTERQDSNNWDNTKPGENHKFNEGSDTTVSHDIDKQDNDSSNSNGYNNRGRGRGRGGFRGNDRGRGRNFNNNEGRNNSGKENSIFVKGIDYGATEDDLRNVFEKHGEITSCKILKDKETNKSKGIGFVNFADKQSAMCALDDADNLVLNGRYLQLRFADDKDGEFRGRKGGFNHREDNGNNRGGRGRGGFRGNDRGRGRGRGNDRGRGRGGFRGGNRNDNRNNERNDSNWSNNREDDNNGWGSIDNRERSRSKEKNNDNEW